MAEGVANHVGGDKEKQIEHTPQEEQPQEVPQPEPLQQLQDVQGPMVR